MWTSYLHRRKILNEDNISNMMDYICRGALTITFYQKIKDNLNAIDVLLIPNLLAKRRGTYEQLGLKFEGDVDEIKNLEEILRQVIEGETPKDILDDLYLNWLQIFKRELTPSKPQELNEFIILLSDEILA